MMLLTAAAGTALAALFAAPQKPRSATIQLPPSEVVTGTTLADVDGDGLTDLTIACHNPASGRRSLRVHLRDPRSRTFAPKPMRPAIAIERDVVAFTWCDCDATPGRELLLLNPENVVAVAASRDTDGTVRYRRLASHALIWPAADEEQVVGLADAAIDFDGDGDEDLVLPEANGWSIWLQEPAEKRDGDAPASGQFAKQLRLPLPARLGRLAGTGSGNRSLSASRNSLTLRFGNQDSDSGPLVRVSTRTPPSRTIDYDGDGSLDLLCYRDQTMFAGMQRTTTGALERLELPLPVSPNRLKLVDPAFDVRWHRIDADARPDLVLTSSAQRDGNVEVRVDLFRTREDGSWPKTPDRRLRMQPLAMPPQLVDANGDGSSDLICITLRTSSLPSLPGSASAVLEAQLNIFGNRNGGFATPALLNLPLPLAKASAEAATPFLVVRPGRRDIPGDVLLRTTGDLEQRLLKKDGDRLTLGPAIARVAIPEDGRVVRADTVGDDVLIVLEHEVRHVRFRR